MNKKLKLLLIVFISFILIFSTTGYAIEDNTIKIEKSESFDKWEKLSKEEKTTTIEPSYTNIDLKESIRRSKLNNLLGGEAETLESYFNLREELDNKIVVKKQIINSCWAYSYTTAMETTMARKYNKFNLEYSPMHLEYKTKEIFSRDVGYGGNCDIALAYSASGYGPVYESDFPFSEVYKNESFVSNVESEKINIPARARVTDATIFASIYKEYKNGTVIYKDSSASEGYTEYSENEVKAIRYLIKKHIKENGGVSATFYQESDSYIDKDGNYISSYYNNETNAYCCTETAAQNHGVTIIGWDDNFKKENFVSNHQPIHDGAYIVVNSWGTDFADDGFFYVSYDDTVIEQVVYGVASIEQNTKTYDNIYEHDQLGRSFVIPFTDETRTYYIESGYAANVFSREAVEGKEEYLTEVGLILDATQGIEIYVNPNDDNLNNTTLVATATGSNALEAGYHVIKLASPVKLIGTKFVVKVKYINSEKNLLSIECNLYDSGITNVQNNAYNAAKSNPGESFISKDGITWSDMDGYVFGDITFKNTNACIKGFTKYSATTIRVPVEEVRLNKKSINLVEGDNTTLVATIQPENATNKNVIWTSSDESIATVENGKVTGIKKGNATINVTTEDGSYADSCIVTVNEKTYPVTGLTLDKTSGEMYVGDSINLIATVLPTNATNKNIRWTSSNENIATVTNAGVVKAVGEGETTITATTEDGNHKATCNITVKTKKVEPTIVSVTGVTLNKTSDEMYAGDSRNLTATVSPANATNKNVSWTSSNENIATVSSTGVIKATREGTAIITVTTEDGNHKATCNVTVKQVKTEEPAEPIKPTIISVTGVTLNKISAEMYVGDSTNLVATVSPANATNKNVTWTSSNENIATVSNAGVVKATREGTATITVTTEDGKYKATSEIKVKKKQPVTISATGVKLNLQKSSIQVGENTNLVATIMPENASNKEVIWTSSNESVATVSKQGIITTLKEGKTIITVTTVDGKYKDSCELTVTKKTNNDDDIYKEVKEEVKDNNKDNKEVKEKNEIKEDNTQIIGKLPQTGEELFFEIGIVIVFGMAIVYYIKYRKNRDIN